MVICVVLHRGVSSDESGAAKGIRRTSTVGEVDTAYLRRQYSVGAAKRYSPLAIDWNKGNDRNKHGVGRGGLLARTKLGATELRSSEVATTVILLSITGTRIAFNLLERQERAKE